MSRRKRHEAHANHERWLVSYADFITLLFAFFVVLYSSSQVDQRKVGKLAMAIQVAFQELGIFPAGTSKAPLDTTTPMPFNSVQLVENAERTAALGRIAPPMKGALGVAVEGEMGVLRQELEKALAPEIKRHEVALRSEPHGLVISLREVGFFDSGSARLRVDSQEAFSRIAKVLLERPYRIRIEGHTDNVPIHTPQFASNWELSTARSTELVKILIEKHDFAAERLSAAGYAEFHPVAGNESEEGRKLNRRVDVVILAPLPAAPTAVLDSPPAAPPIPNARASASPR